MVTQRAITVLIGAVLLGSAASILLGAAPVAMGSEPSYGSTSVAEFGGPNGSTIPPDGPAYGVDRSEFFRLWSEDAENRTRPGDWPGDGNTSSREREERALARSTDIPFATPPKAAERWTQGDLQDYDPMDESTSVAPTTATLTDGPYIKDAFVSIAAVQPSTILHATNETGGTNETSGTRFIVPGGEVVAVSDFRVALPEGNVTDREREVWSTVDASVDRVTLEADGKTLSTGEGPRSILPYSGLSGSVTFEVEATITAEIEEVTEICSDWNATTERCEDWDSFDRSISTQLTVSDTLSAEVTQLSNITGSRVTFESDPDRVGVAVHPDTEWSTISVDGDVNARSSWWFYTTGIPGWRDVVHHKANGSTTASSSFRPVQVHAFPSEENPYVPTDRINGSVPLQIDEVWGDERAGPELPAVIDLDAANPYMNADSVALTSDILDPGALETVTVTGIVRGQSATTILGEPRTVREADLSISFPEADSSRTTVRAQVLDASSGNPVSTGTVTVRNRSAPLDANGTATITIADPGTSVRVEYVPEPWWRAEQLYSSTETTAIVSDQFPDFQSMIDLVLVTLLWFLPVGLLAVGLDYVTDGEFIGLNRHS